jgi:hypothetical protein
LGGPGERILVSSSSRLFYIHIQCNDISAPWPAGPDASTVTVTQQALQMQEQTQHLPYAQEQLRLTQIICSIGSPGTSGSWSAQVAVFTTYTVLATSPCTVNAATVPVSVTKCRLTLTICQEQY